MTEKTIKAKQTEAECNASLIDEIDSLVDQPRQLWLFGAGISINAGIPLMTGLTLRVSQILTKPYSTYFNAIKNELPDDCHVEHVLSHLGDLGAIAKRVRSGKANIGKEELTTDELSNFHNAIQEAIKTIVQWGYKSATSTAAEQVGKPGHSIIQIDDHSRFIRALFEKRRAGIESRPPIAFFSLNYDTLLEDALALNRITSTDGFNGGAMAFWNPDEVSANFDCPFSGQFGAKLYKLHGSIDWFASKEDVVVRSRDSANYPSKQDGNLLIYPQATKYRSTQKDPFARIFKAFRTALCDDDQTVLCIAGYSFGDDHVNEEILRALKQRNNKLTVLAFCSQHKTSANKTGLASTLTDWLSQTSETWSRRIIVAGKQDIFHGSTVPICSSNEPSEFPWWSFSGITDFLENGPEEMRKYV